jgi:hypothetical protein
VGDTHGAPTSEAAEAKGPLKSSKERKKEHMRRTPKTISSTKDSMLQIHFGILFLFRAPSKKKKEEGEVDDEKTRGKNRITQS